MRKSDMRLRGALGVFCVLLAVFTPGCWSWFTEYKYGPLDHENVDRSWKTDKTAEVKVDFPEAREGAPNRITITCEGTWILHEAYTNYYQKIRVGETYCPLWELIEIPVTFLGTTFMLALGLAVTAFCLPFYWLYVGFGLPFAEESQWQGYSQIGMHPVDLDEEYKPWTSKGRLKEFFPKMDGAEIILFPIMLGVYAVMLTGFFLIPSVFTALFGLPQAIFRDDFVLFIPRLIFGYDEDDDALDQAVTHAIDPFHNVLSRETESVVEGEYYEEKKARYRKERGLLAEEKVKVSLLGRELEFLTDAKGQVLLDASSFRDLEVRGLRGGTPLSLSVATPEGKDGQATLEIDRKTGFLPMLALLEGSRWEGAKPDSAAEVSLEHSFEGTLSAGRKAVLNLSLTNRGSREIVRAFARVRSKTPCFDHWFTTFGSLAPGARVERKILIEIPADEGSWPHRLRFEVFEDGARIGAAVEAVVKLGGSGG